MLVLSVAIGVIWVVFWIFWLVFASNSKKSIGFSSTLRHFAAVRLVIFLFALALIKYSPGFGSGGITSNKLVMIAGFIVFLLGLLLAIWARLYLGENWGMPMTQKQDPELVTSGPYSYVRHPIYTGILTAMFGSALASNAYWLLLMAIVGTYFIYSAKVEEKIMASQFPKEYAAYKKKTKMLIPFVV